MFDERVENCLEELKRADHLVYVSLKYTRTCDVIKNVIKRLISAFDLAVNEVMVYSKSEGAIKDIPISKEGKIKKVKELLGKQSHKYFKLYDLLKKIDKAEYSKCEEFRKNVTLITKTKPEIRVKTDSLNSYFETTKEFVYLAHEFMKKWQE